MIISRVHVRDFRCIYDESLDCAALTALVGPNGSGKSTFLRALELFYAPAPVVTEEDFYNRESAQAIEISVTFNELEKDAEEKFHAYLDKGGLTITRVFTLEDGRATNRFYGNRLQNPDFAEVRRILDESGKRPAKAAYDALRTQSKYTDLPAERSADEAIVALQAWEAAHTDECRWERDEGQFFGFREVAQGYLGDYTRFILIPAVREASEEGVEGKGSAITDLMNLVVRTALAASEDLKKFEVETLERYNKIMASPATTGKLEVLEGDLGATLRTYVPTAGVKIQWITEGGVTIGLPRANVRLLEDAYPSPVDRAGHGLQRAFVLSMLQHLASVRIRSDVEAMDGGQAGPTEPTGAPVTTVGTTKSLPHLIIAIEEPELYQHPSRQRHLAKVLLELSNGSITGVVSRTQVLYATHSPLFVGIDRFDHVRVVRKVPGANGKPGVARVTRTEMDEVAGRLWQTCSMKDRAGNDIPRFTGDSLRPRLQPLMTPWMSEAFFADVVVLVEGEADRAAVVGAALVKGEDFESMGIAVIPCGGKSNMDRPALVFKGLGIPTYLVWDADKGDTEGLRANHILQRIVGETPVDWPAGIRTTYACFESDLETTLRAEMGPAYGEEMSSVMREFGYANMKQGEKNPRVVQEALKRVGAKGGTSTTLQAIVAAIRSLHKEQARVS